VNEAVEPTKRPDRVVLYDGVCKFCHGTVRFLIARDPQGLLRFASQQSALGQRLMRERGVDGLEWDTLILLDGERTYVRSDAAIRILAALGGGWQLVHVLRVVPRALRDRAYSLYARNRYRLFGKLEACALPTPDYRSRFLDEP